MVASSGIVYLVGAGPGHPGLVTKRALDLLERADVVVYDRLVPRGLLERARAGSELIYVGKGPDAGSTSQEEINRLLVEHAGRGRQVVRLKGGDPFVFGRGGEEAQALAGAGIRFEVVPGVTAGIAAPAYAGIPVTHRDAASAVAFVTGHEDAARQDTALDWDALAAFPGTLVFYMGVRNLGDLTEQLIRHGRSREEAAAVVERGSMPGQRTVTGALGALAELARAEGIRAPAVTVVGPVAALRQQLSWLEQAPLHGSRVVVTRARPQASELAERLSELGAAVVEAPAIRIVPRVDDAAVKRIAEAIGASEFAVICLTSSNGATLLMRALAAQGLDARALAGSTIAAIGSGTASTLAEHGLRADIVPERFVAEELAEQLVARGVRGLRVLIARAAEARDALPDALRKAGAEVEVVALYDTVREALGDEQLAAVAEADYVTFTSSSTVRYFVEAIGGADRFPNARVVTIGPITSEAARELGIQVHTEALRHDIDGLVAALVEDVRAA
jgi:uroporphyrinogen III methyltransferase/synthase